MIVKNEEEHLANCLNSVKDIVDEIIIVDTGSMDATKEIARQFTDKIYDFTWIDDFSAARNFSFSKGKMDYLLWLDADDILLEKDQKMLLQLKLDLNSLVDSVMFRYHYAHDEQGNQTLTFMRERLVKRSKNPKWIGFLHETIDINGVQIESEIAVTHCRIHGDSDRNLNIYRRKIEEGIVLNSRDQYYYGKELYYHGLYQEATKELEKFVKEPCWIEDHLDALYCMSDCYQQINENRKALEVLFESFILEIPRAECLYRIASILQKEKKLTQAIYWYQLIFQTEKPINQVGFSYPEYWTWMPHLELCVCYYQMGNLEKARYHNEQAERYVPNHPSVIHNNVLFKPLNIENIPVKKERV